jgi:hypothetical protein
MIVINLIRLLDVQCLGQVLTIWAQFILVRDAGNKILFNTMHSTKKTFVCFVSATHKACCPSLSWHGLSTAIATALTSGSRRRRKRTRARISHKDHLRYESTPPTLLYIMREGYFTSISTVHFARFSCDNETGYDFDISASMSAQGTVGSRIDREEREFRRPPKKRQPLPASVCRLFI